MAKNIKRHFPETVLADQLERIANQTAPASSTSVFESPVSTCSTTPAIGLVLVNYRNMAGDAKGLWSLALIGAKSRWTDRRTLHKIVDHPAGSRKAVAIRASVA